MDPALLAAKSMLSRALAELALSPMMVGAPSSMAVVQIPSPEWAAPARDAWRDIVCEAARSGDGDDDDFDSISSKAWVAFLGDGPDKDSFRERDAVAKAIWMGKLIVGFSTKPEESLPRDLLQGADHYVALRGPTPADVAEVVRALSGDEPTSTILDADAAELTPRLLRLARRVEQTPGGYIARLLHLLDLERRATEVAAAPAAAVAPRNEPTLARLHGMDEAVNWGNDVARDIQAYRDGTVTWGEVDRGCLLSGPPGCGKTLFARALAATCGVALVSGSYGEWHGSGNAHQGDLLKAMRKTFKAAREQAPSVLFIDEIDSFPNRSTITHRFAEWEIQVVNALLAEIDGVEGREGVVLLAACNHPQKLDPALVRSGRLDRHVVIGLPDRAALATILREQLGPDLVNADLSHAATMAAGATGADCERMVRGARRRARNADRDVTMPDLIAEIGGSDGLSPADMLIAAIHEAGHAVAACVLQPGGLSLVSLRASGDRGGHMELGYSSAFATADDLHVRLKVLLSGRAAEQVILGRPSSGAGGDAGSDLSVATGIAAMAVAAFGFDDDLGLTWLGMPERATLPSFLRGNGKVAASVTRIMQAAYDDALALMVERRPAIEAVARGLTEHTVLDGTAVQAIVDHYGPTEGDPR